MLTDERAELLHWLRTLSDGLSIATKLERDLTDADDSDFALTHRMSLTAG